MAQLITPFTFVTLNPAPEGYKCSVCGVQGPKLWRPAHMETLFCAPCALKREFWEGANVSIGADGTVDDRTTRNGMTYGRGDELGDLLPAVPTEDGASFYGFTSVPPLGEVWWRALPTYPQEPGTLSALVEEEREGK